MKTEDDLAAWWQEQGASKDLPGSLWATLTHARCTPALEHQVLGQVHMLQHQVGMATRVELARFEALIDENAVLARELAATQQRNTRQAQEHARQVEALQSELVRTRGQAMAAHSVAEGLRQDMQALRDTVPQLQSRQALAQRNSQHEERMAAMLRALQQARGEVERLRDQLEAANEPIETLGNAPTADSNAADGSEAGNPLSAQAVLCVGGRTSSVPLYRKLVEGQGARFLHHDGGEEHSASQLESTLAAADLVICQAGCVSHNAYWRVKDHCKRTGKRCVFVETPSRAALARALADVVQAS
jgi:type II secretory pathway pseudopilin PulG